MRKRCCGSQGCPCLPFAVIVLIIIANLGNCQESKQVCVDWAAGGQSDCDIAPEGGLLLPPSEDFPSPLAFFPLTGGSVYSWPLSQIQGINRGAEWVQDDFFGSTVVYCTQTDGDVILLDSVPYGKKDGNFAINLWIRQPTNYATNQGDEYQYIYSHTAQELVSQFNPQTQNQIQMFLPEEDHQLFGVLRVILKDSDDTQTTTFLDSDGIYTDNSPRNLATNHQNLTDGYWHMVTLTTLAGSKPGFSIYVDGEKAAEVPQDNEVNVVDGGDPLLLDSPIHLCGRVDDDDNRHYDGYLTRLSLFDTYLSDDQVRALYTAVMNNSDAGQTTSQDKQPSGGSDERYTVDGDKCEFPQLYRGEILTDCQESDNGERCMVNGQWKACAPRSSAPAPAPAPSQSAAPDRNATLPEPFAYFPLEGNLVGSLDGKYNGTSSAMWIDDARFGIVPICDQEEGHVITLETVPYAESGSFAVNFWIKWTNVSGEVFQYVFSHQNKEVQDPLQLFNQDPAIWGPNQVQIFLPEASNVAHGIIRSVVKDGDDLPIGSGYRIYLDSDGKVSGAGTLSKQSVNVEDSLWHMVSLSTRPDGKKGFSIYIDGKLASEVQEGQTYLDPDGEKLDIPGGNPMNLTGDIQLCGRYDRNPLRDFTGSITQLRLYNQALNPAQIERLFLYGGGEDYGLIQTLPGTSLPSLAEIIPGINFTETYGPLTVDGRTCEFPFVFRGESYDECTQIAGDYICQVGGQFVTCDRTITLGEPYPAPPTSAPSPQMTVDGEECNFPMVYEGVIYNECIEVEGEFMCMLLGNNTLVACEKPEVRGSQTPAISTLNLPPELIVPTVCKLSDPSKCQSGEVCAKVSESSQAVRYMNDVEEQGICATPPSSGVLLPDSNPTPRAYFPLTGGLLQSWPYDDFQGTSVGVDTIADSEFDSVFRCYQGEMDFITLDAVPYASNGSFAVNLWLKTGNMTGAMYQYVFAHSESTSLSPIQKVQLYLPEEQHGFFGLIRALIHDANDPEDLLVYADSDNQIANQGYRVITDKTIVDQQWHMVTLTTHTDFSPGFSMYIDGVMVADHSKENPGPDDLVYGGGPMQLGDRIYLCGRYDQNTERHFDGFVTQLSLYDTPLDIKQIQDLYKMVKSDAVFSPPLTLPIGPPPSTVPEDLDRGWCRFPFVYKGVRHTDCVPINGVYMCNSLLGDDLIECRENFVTPCSTENAFDCPINQVCGKISPKSAAMEYLNSTDQNGICADPPAMGVLLPDSNPIPLAYFPLVGDMLSSWPHQDYIGTSQGVQTVPDQQFISVQECKQGQRDYLSFDSVPYAENGTFAINVWMKTMNMSGPIFQYVYAHSQFPPAPDNQRVQLYLPEQDHGLYGLIRALVRDSNDPLSQVYLDSDNLVANQDFRTVPDKTVVDGEWHMITLSTHTDFSPGYSLFIDGNLVGDHSTENPGQIKEVFGGDPMNLDDRVYLCGRYDQDAQRHFDGHVTQLSLYDTPLNLDQIQALYKIVVKDASFASEEEKLPIGPPPSTVPENLDRSKCVFPFVYKGVRFSDCALIMGTYECKDENQEWVQCPESSALPPTNPECIFPFFYRSQIYNECIPLAGKRRCQNAAQEFVDCYPEDAVAEAPVAEAGSPQPIRVTQDADFVSYSDCVFPFEYEEQSYTECIEIDGSLKCGDAQNKLIPCHGSAVPGPPQVDINSECSFPYIYRGEIVTECIDISGQLSCQNANNEFIPCNITVTQADQNLGQPTSYQSLANAEVKNRTTTDGRQCIFPAVYRGQAVTDCVDVAGQKSCLTNDIDNPSLQVWAECDIQGEDRVELEYANRVTVQGVPCQIPFEYKQTLYYDCVKDGAMETCPVESGIYQECAPVGSSGGFASGVKTEDGYQCKFPFVYRGGVYNKCVEVSGQNVCKIAEDDQLHVCVGNEESGLVAANITWRRTVDNELCYFPFIYRGEAYTDCVEIAGKPRCQNAAGEYKVCMVNLGDEERELVTIGNRVTVDGDACSFPIIYRGQIQTDCVTISGREVCKTEDNDDWQECAAVITEPVIVPTTTVDGYNCTFPFFYRSLEFTECTEIDDKIQCLIQEDDEWHECSTSNTATDLLVNKNSRTTVDGKQCLFPTVYQGMIIDDCADVGGVLSCKTDEDNDWHECATQVDSFTVSTTKTTKGNFCVFPFFYRGIIYTQCIEISGRFICEADSGHFEECAPTSDTRPSFDGVSQMDSRFTVEGYECAFPYTYRGNEIRECIEVAGRMVCQVNEDPDWHECAPGVLPTPVNRTTVDGYQCSLPLQYRGQLLNDCTPIDGKPQCKIDEDQAWHECDVDSGVVLMSSGGRKSTVDGQFCIFPLVYAGSVVNECIQINDVMQCKVETDDDWHECAPEVQEITRMTTDGLKCSFPYTYRGVVIDDCTEIAGQLSCKVDEDDQWHQCANYTSKVSSTVQRTTTDGFQCIFPAVYRGTVLNDCAEVAGTMSCQIREDGEWHQCAMDIADRPSNVLTTDGFTCDFPFVYQGLIFTNCIEVSGKMQCMIKDDSDFHECQPLISQPMLTASTTRTTTDGQNCIFPTVYRGNSVNDCIEIAGSMVCMVAEDNQWHECAPSNTTNILAAPSRTVRSTIDGLTCKFPVIYRNEVVEDCVELSGAYRCKTVEDEQWHECKPIEDDQQLLTVTDQVTVSGEPCVFPFVYENQILTECVQVDNRYQCQTVNQTWQECDVTRPSRQIVLSTPTRYTTDGEECQLPFVYESVVYTDCLAISGTPRCLVDGTMKDCVEMGRPGAVGSISSSNRTTVSGKQCNIPFVHRGQVLYDCAPIAGKDMCKNLDGVLEQCTPQQPDTTPITIALRYTVEGFKCVFPYVWMSRVTTDCVRIGLSDSCRVREDNQWHECLPPGENTNVTSPFTSAQRYTVDGEPCDLPNIYRGDIITDCIEFLNGEPSCPVASENGAFKTCAPIPEIEGAPSFTVIGANRTTITGGVCVFPFLYRSNFYYDCVELAQQERCQNSAGNWEVCAPAADFQPVSIGAECRVGTYSGEPGACLQGICAPIYSPFIDEQSGENRMGQCISPPIGGPTRWAVSVPTPMAYFPLTGGSVDSWPSKTYSGEVFEIEWRTDPQFSSTVQCVQGEMDYIKLDNVKYGEKGPLTVSLWIKKRLNDTSSGKAFEYVFSHTASSGYAPWIEDSVQIFLPEENHIAHGLVRAILKDVNDYYQGRQSEVYLDSDGLIGANFKRNVPGRVDMHDSQWHMVTITTQPSGKQGYRLYIDGILSTELAAGSERTPIPSVADINNTIVVDGGEGNTMDGEIYLCGRSDLDVNRHFEGSVAHLMLFDLALSSSEVEAMYNMFFDYSGELPLTKKICEDNPDWGSECLMLLKNESAVANRVTENGDQCELPLIHRGNIYNDCLVVGGVERCKVNGDWYPCETTGSEPAQIQNVLTFDGRECVFPFSLNGVDYYECLDIRPDIGYKICQVEGGEYQACMDLPWFVQEPLPPSPSPVSTIVRYTEEGGVCQFPFVFDGIIYNDCVSIIGKDMCKNTTGQWNACLPYEASPEAVQTIPRKTVSGADCEIPFVYRATIYTECTQVFADFEQCMNIQTGNLEECAPLDVNASPVPIPDVEVRYSVTGEKCMDEYQYRQDLVRGCLPLEIGEVCLTESGIWAACSVPRVTVKGESCEFPYIAPDNTTQYVCQVNNQGLEMCMASESKEMQECALPSTTLRYKRETVDGVPCQQPFQMDNTLYYDCAEQDGVDICEDINGDINECAPELGTPIQLQPGALARRRTISGQMCRIPFEYRGSNFTNCLLLNSQEYCVASDGQLQQCLPSGTQVQLKSVSEPENSGSGGSSGTSSAAIGIIVAVLVAAAIVVIVAGAVFIRRRWYLNQNKGGDFKQFQGSDLEQSVGAASSDLAKQLQTANSRSALKSWTSLKESKSQTVTEMEMTAPGKGADGNGNGNGNGSGGHTPPLPAVDSRTQSVADSAMVSEEATVDVPLDDDERKK